MTFNPHVPRNFVHNKTADESTKQKASGPRLHLYQVPRGLDSASTMFHL